MTTNTKLYTICPVCEQDIEIKAQDLKLAIRHKAETGNKVLVHCPECCRSLKMPDDMPKDDLALNEWIGNVGDDFGECVPMLDDTQAKTPNGYIGDLGVKLYRPGSGGKPLAKYPYMFRYGINPECYLAKNNSQGRKPFVIKS